MIPKIESALFKMKLYAKGYSRLLILNSTIVFLNVVSKVPFWENLVPKLQSALFKMKVATKEYSVMLILTSKIVIFKFRLKIHFLD